MSKQIKIIWALSLMSVLLLIGVQGYWLFNQYKYVLDSYSEEIAQQVLQAGEEEYLLRKDDELPSRSYMIRTNKDSVISNQNFYINIDRRALDSTGNNRLEFADKLFHSKLFIGGQSVIQTDTTLLDLNFQTNLLDLNFQTNLSGDDLTNAVGRAVANITNSFSEEKLDSILTSELPDLKYSIVPRNDDDAYNDALWKREGNIFDSRLIVYYAYSPLENKGVFININLPIQPVLNKMGVQLIISVGLTLLLIVCLVFQLKTILKQRKINEIRAGFVNTMVHELRRPVQTLKTFVSFLNDGKMRSDTETAEQIVRDSMFELDNMSAYLSNLKDMLRIDSETTSLLPGKINLRDLLEKIIRTTHIPTGKEVNFSTVYDNDNLSIDADPVHIANVLSNLIENAVKYSGNSVNIEISAGHEKRNIRISIKDNGIGIPAAEHEKVFAKFYRGSNIPDKNIPGIGLGLSYVKLIVEAHHGNISLKSQPGTGTGITIYLPQ